MVIEESFHSSDHRLLAFNFRKPFGIQVCFAVCLPPTLGASFRSLMKVFAFIETEVLLAEVLQLGDALGAVWLRQANCFGSFESTLEVGGEEVADIDTGSG